MIDDTLATIKTLAQVIIANRKGHKRRARNMGVFELEVIRLIDTFNETPISHGGQMTDDFLAQVQDALTAIRTLSHGPLGDPFNETHFDIEQRLYLVIDLIDWLREKIKEAAPYTLFQAMTEGRTHQIEAVTRDSDIPF